MAKATAPVATDVDDIDFSALTAIPKESVAPSTRGHREAKPINPKVYAGCVAAIDSTGLVGTSRVFTDTVWNDEKPLVIGKETWNRGDIVPAKVIAFRDPLAIEAKRAMVQIAKERSTPGHELSVRSAFTVNASWAFTLGEKVTRTRKAKA